MKEQALARYYGDLEAQRARSRQWTKDNPEKSKAKDRKYKSNPDNRPGINATTNKWRASNPDKVMEYNRKQRLRRLGVEEFDFDGLFASQGHACAICRTTEKPKSKGWHIDHCHSTGRIRGILCQHCNLGLGRFRDNLDTLKAAEAYLLKDPI